MGAYRVLDETPERLGIESAGDALAQADELRPAECLFQGSGLEEAAQSIGKLEFLKFVANHFRRQPLGLDGVSDSIDELLAIARQHARVGQVPEALPNAVARLAEAASRSERLNSAAILGDGAAIGLPGTAARAPMAPVGPMRIGARTTSEASP